jgi:hypothetical protein
MNRLVILRPLASAALLAVTAMSVAPTFAARPQARSLSRVSQQALLAPPGLHGTLVALHRAQLTADLAVANGSLVPLRFTSAAQQRRLRVGSRLTVSGDARDHVRLLVRALRLEGVSTRAHIHGTVARRLGRAAVELLGMHGAAVMIRLGHVRVIRVLPRAGRFVRTAASIKPGDRLDTAVTLTGAGAVATGTATVAAPPPAPAQVEVEGLITAVDPTAGTITIQDEDGPSTVVSVSAAGTYHVGQEIEVVGTPTGPGGSAVSVQAQYVTLDLDDGPAPTAAPVGAHIKVEGRITAVNAAAGTITVQDDDGGPATVVALGAARGPFYVWQKVEVYGTVTSAGSNGATVQAQFIRVKSSDGDDGDNDGGDNDDD